MQFQKKTGLVTKGILCFALVGCLIGSLAGCRRERTVASSTARKASTEDLLHNAIHQLRPANYSISADMDKPVALLNSWLETRTEHSGKGASAASSPSAIPAGWVDEKESERLHQKAFDLRDAIHVRDSMLTHTIANYLASRSKTDLQQVMGVFDFVVRNISLRGPAEADLPLGIYHLLLLGKGSPEDRAWVCSALLKQLRIDTVVVQPSEAGADPDGWLLGVILKDQVYLFDVRLGFAIPSSDDLSQPLDTPATLEQIVSHGDWLKQLALRADQPYAIEAESLKQPRIMPIAQSSFWFHRMKVLEEALPAADLCVLYDPLVDDEGRTGLLTRLTSSIRDWKVEQFQQWPHLKHEGLAVTPAMKQQFEMQLRSFELPIPVIINEEKQTASLGAPERKMLRIRTDQLMGNFEDSTKRYFSIRHLEIDAEQLQFRELALLNQLAAEDAIYWSAICKFEAREFDAAIEQLNGYLKRFERTGRWTFSARALLGECYAELGKFDVAAAELEKSTRSEDPYRAANAIRIKRWKARAAKATGTAVQP